MEGEEEEGGKDEVNSPGRNRRDKGETYPEGREQP
jgi:hypothetical protein